MRSTSLAARLPLLALVPIGMSPLVCAQKSIPDRIEAARASSMRGDVDRATSAIRRIEFDLLALRGMNDDQRERRDELLASLEPLLAKSDPLADRWATTVAKTQELLIASAKRYRRRNRHRTSVWLLDRASTFGVSPLAEKLFDKYRQRLDDDEMWLAGAPIRYADDDPRRDRLAELERSLVSGDWKWHEGRLVPPPRTKLAQSALWIDAERNAGDARYRLHFRIHPGKGIPIVGLVTGYRTRPLEYYVSEVGLHGDGMFLRCFYHHERLDEVELLGREAFALPPGPPPHDIVDAFDVTVRDHELVLQCQGHTLTAVVPRPAHGGIGLFVTGAVDMPPLSLGPLRILEPFPEPIEAHGAAATVAAAVREAEQYRSGDEEATVRHLLDIRQQVVRNVGRQKVAALLEPLDAALTDFDRKIDEHLTALAGAAGEWLELGRQYVDAELPHTARVAFERAARFAPRAAAARLHRLGPAGRGEEVDQPHPDLARWFRSATPIVHGDVEGEWRFSDREVTSPELSGGSTATILATTPTGRMRMSARVSLDASSRIPAGIGFSLGHDHRGALLCDARAERGEVVVTLRRYQGDETTALARSSAVMPVEDDDVELEIVWDERSVRLRCGPAHVSWTAPEDFALSGPEAGKFGLFTQNRRGSAFAVYRNLRIEPLAPDD